ncbi:hypothetical protein N3K66_000269 [Trichothecium roseum]|uniref:Uncharacterized protein n=1 Tax=Trichothecium roseum TaxID=47278 RepID=A0ACC0VDE9_9HYPO|nr:hypothetical protein N3K66_000269 [Trichothecium roseum]
MQTGKGGSDSGGSISTPVRKEKKRVNWHESSNSGGRESQGVSATLSPSQTPTFIPGAVPPGAPDADELSRALSKILTDEEHQKQQEQEHEQKQKQKQGQKQQETRLQDPRSEEEDQFQQGGPSAIRRPRPALRRNTSYDVAQEREEADKAEQLASPRQLRSMNDARNRADQLAISLGSHSAPGSRRNSSEIDASFQSLVGDSGGSLPGTFRRPAVIITDDEGGESRDDEAGGPRSPMSIVGGQGVTSREPSPNQIRHRYWHSQPYPLDNRFDNRGVAEGLVRSHMTDSHRDLFQQRVQGSASALSSNSITMQNQVEDDPEQYMDPSQDHPRGSPRGHPQDPPQDHPHARLSAMGAAGIARLLQYPPPLSPCRPDPRRRDQEVLLELDGPPSPVALASSSIFAAPGSSEISDRMNEKIKSEQKTHKSHKSKAEQARITVHIAGILDRHRYLEKLCRALMMYGAPTHRLEEYMIMSARVLEIEGQFLYIPSCMIISFDDSTTHTTEVKIVRVPQGIDLGRLRDVHDIYKEVVHDKLGVEEGTRKLDAVMRKDPKYPTWFRVFLYGVASSCVAPFAFQGRFIDLGPAFLLGAILGVLQLVLAPSNELYAHVFEVSAAVVTSFLARAFGSINGGNTFCFSALAQSSIALILPGYMVLCSSLELQSYNIVAGSVRMVHAMIYTLFLGYGITIGASLYGMMDKNATSATACEAPLSREWHFLFVPGFTLCLCLVNQAKWRQTPVMIAMSIAGFSVNSYCSQFFTNNTPMSNMLGALTVGILSNLYSRLGRHVENAWLDFVEFWHEKVRPRLMSTKNRKRLASKGSDVWSASSVSDPESRPGSPTGRPPPTRQRRRVGYSLAAAAMLPAIFVQVPSGLAAGGSLLSGVTSADEITSSNTNGGDFGNLDGTAFNVLFKVIQVAIGISVGLFMSALIVYPLGKRRSGLFSF